ncbi:MAG TPA: class I SAM-dependent methyltransferase, partial [Archangium sp.]
MTSTQEEVEIGYDISNEFFRLGLDERMHYTSAVYDENHTTLEQAQRNKSRWLADFAEVKPSSLVLDIG